MWGGGGCLALGASTKVAQSENRQVFRLVYQIPDSKWCFFLDYNSETGFDANNVGAVRFGRAAAAVSKDTY